MGVYKGVKVIFSEARLYKDKKSQKAKESVFDGIFVLLETSSNIIEGHTILTADSALAKRAAQTIWRIETGRTRRVDEELIARALHLLNQEEAA